MCTRGHVYVPHTCTHAYVYNEIQLHAYIRTYITAPRGAQDGPRARQDGPKTGSRGGARTENPILSPEEGPRRPQDGSQEGPRGSQEAPRGTKDARRGVQEVPKRAPQMLQEHAKFVGLNPRFHVHAKFF